MKQNKVRAEVAKAMRKTLFGSTERTDALDAVERKFMLSSGELKRLCLFAGQRCNYWVR